MYEIYDKGLTDWTDKSCSLALQIEPFWAQFQPKVYLKVFSSVFIHFLNRLITRLTKCIAFKEIRIINSVHSFILYIAKKSWVLSPLLRTQLELFFFKFSYIFPHFFNMKPISQIEFLFCIYYSSPSNKKK